MALMDFDYAQKTKVFASDGLPGNDGYRVTSSMQTAAPATVTEATFNSGTDETTVYVSADQTLRVRLDTTAATATAGLVVPANTTVQLYCRPATTNAVRVFNTSGSTANVSIQFLRKV